MCTHIWQINYQNTCIIRSDKALIEIEIKRKKHQERSDLVITAKHSLDLTDLDSANKTLKISKGSFFYSWDSSVFDSSRTVNELLELDSSGESSSRPVAVKLSPRSIVAGSRRLTKTARIPTDDVSKKVRW